MDLDFSAQELSNMNATASMQKPDAMALAQLAAETGMPNISASQIFLDTKISTSIYDTMPNPTLEAATERLLLEATYNAVVFKALGCGVTPMTYLRQLIAYGLTRNQFKLDEYFTDDKGVRSVPPDAKRKKEEDSKDGINTNKVIAEYLREPTFSQINYMCKALGISTHAGLVVCVNILVDIDETTRLLADSKDAMNKYAEAKKKQNLMTQFMNQV